MTLPDERYRAVLETREFLFALLSPKKTPRVPYVIRLGASRCLRHYPAPTDMESAARQAPMVWGRVVDD